MSDKNVITFNTENFESQIGQGVSLVDFWAEWCAPCRAQGPIIESLAQEMGEDFSIGKLDVDANSAIAQKYNVMSIPTIILFKDGKVAKELVGLQEKKILETALRELI